LNNLVIVGHPDKNSFCHNGIFNKIHKILNDHPTQNIKTIDLYEDKLHRDKKVLIENYKKMVTWSDRIYFISPVWWFRLTPKMETFFDEVFTPGFAYEFVNITKTYAYPRSFLKKKKIRCYLTHGAPSLPVWNI
jgi:NAD(P)H dehydrogenase (quinone)